jgi:2-polyprenyl-6-methoxyphenol hydroxylase-like FAD-dependent oxidoreductase
VRRGDGGEDALVLAELVADGAPQPAILARFQQRRLARVRWVRAQTDRRDRLRRLPPVIRHAFLRPWAERTYDANYQPLLATALSDPVRPPAKTPEVLHP